MQLTFAGTIIARDGNDGGADSVTGFMTHRQASVQWAEYLRSTDAEPIARLNRKRSLSGTITPEAFSGLGLAAQELLTFLDTLPDTGPLVVTVSGLQTLFANAVLETIEPVKRMGVTIAAKLTFQVGAGVSLGSSGAVLTDESGAALTDQLGVSLTS